MSSVLKGLGFNFFLSLNGFLLIASFCSQVVSLTTVSRAYSSQSNEISNGTNEVSLISRPNKLLISIEG